MSRASERLSTLADVFRNPQLRRLELSWAGYHLGEWTYFVALSIYAFQEAGAVGLGALGLARMVPAAIALPFGGMLTDRYARQRVLFAIYAARTLAVRRDGDGSGGRRSRVVVFALAGLAAVVSSPVPPGDDVARADAGPHTAGARRHKCLLEHVGGARYPGRPGDRRRPGCHRRRRGGRCRGGSRQRRLRLARGPHPARGRCPRAPQTRRAQPARGVARGRTHARAASRVPGGSCCSSTRRRWCGAC